VSSALVMSNVVSSVRSFASLPNPPGPAELLTRLNGVLFQTTVADCFVTVFYSEMNFKTGELRYCNAGHNWPLVFGPTGELRESLDAGGYMLGISRQIQLVERVVHLSSGEVLLAYSDGLIDTVNPADEPFEIERVRATVRGQLNRSPRQITDLVGEALRSFRASAEEIDDVTMVVVKRVPLPGVEPAESEEVRAW
jgi:sigma-B regulation protein RsbU (phosphoserine phosphatase)